MFDSLGPGLTSGDIFSFTPLDFLVLDGNYDGVAGISYTDVPIVFTGAASSDPLALTFPDAGYEFDLTFGFSEMFSLPLDFSLGGLGLAIEGNPTIDVTFAPTFDVSFGLNRLQGFYVNLDVPGDPKDVGVGQTAISVGLDVVLDPNSSLSLKLFFLDLTASVAAGGSVGFTTSADVGFGTGTIDLQLAGELRAVLPAHGFRGCRPGICRVVSWPTVPAIRDGRVGCGLGLRAGSGWDR